MATATTATTATTDTTDTTGTNVTPGVLRKATSSGSGVHRTGTEPAPIPFTRLARVELRKMFDTRSGMWLMASVAAVAVIATAAVILFAPDSAVTYATFAAAIGFPMAIVLPIIAILSVTSEYSQRSGLTTFTLVPHRGRIIGAKAAVSLVIAIASMLLAAAIGALGNLLGSAIAGTDTVWDISVAQFSVVILSNVLGMAVGFALGVLIRNSPGAIVGYFVYALALPTVFSLLAAFQDWFADARAWVDFNFTNTELFNQVPDAQGWAQLAVSGTIWLLLPLAVGLRLVMRSEVK